MITKERITMEFGRPFFPSKVFCFFTVEEMEPEMLITLKSGFRTFFQRMNPVRVAAPSKGSWNLYKVAGDDM